MRKSKFFGRLLDQSSWKREFTRELTRSFKTAEEQPPKKASILQSNHKSKIRQPAKPKAQYYSARVGHENPEKLIQKKLQSSLKPRKLQSLGQRKELQAKKLPLGRKAEGRSKSSVS